MEKKENPNVGTTNNDDIMNRVNQTFDKIAQDVRQMIDSNDNETTDKGNQYS
ncbi:hypothetical protein [Neobacillus cucumis]|uniref:hypothetical protein n=1 Tax=Neobacillus cucumis TaxID=1740721 RepID=UPI0015E062BE|nr:hypothetical protein [Neobacillus cucumis]